MDKEREQQKKYFKAMVDLISEGSANGDFIKVMGAEKVFLKAQEEAYKKGYRERAKDNKSAFNWNNKLVDEKLQKAQKEQRESILNEIKGMKKKAHTHPDWLEKEDCSDCVYDKALKDVKRLLE